MALLIRFFRLFSTKSQPLQGDLIGRAKALGAAVLVDGFLPGGIVA